MAKSPSSLMPLASAGCPVLRSRAFSNAKRLPVASASLTMTLATSHPPGLGQLQCDCQVWSAWIDRRFRPPLAAHVGLQIKVTLFQRHRQAGSRNDADKRRWQSIEEKGGSCLACQLNRD